MEKVVIGGLDYYIGGKSNGHYDNKFNRAAKLAKTFDSVESHMWGIWNKYGPGQTQGILHSGQCALATLLLLHTGIRVGNEGSAEGYYTKPHPNNKNQESVFTQTYGLTTIKWEHLQVKGDECQFNFVGKKSVENTFTLHNKLIADAIKKLQTYAYSYVHNSNGQVFDPGVFNISAYELTKFIKKEIGDSYSPKDFRCMRANLHASEFISQNIECYNTKKELKADIKRLYEYVASKLNNTAGVCKKSYVWDGLPTYLERLLN